MAKRQSQPNPAPNSVETRGSATRQKILDVLAFARDDHQNPQDSLSRDDLFSRLASGIWGHAPIAEAKRLGYTSTNNDELMQYGKRPYFDRCLRDLIQDGEVVEIEDGFIQLAESLPPGSYVPGSGDRAFRRANLSAQAGELMRSDGGGLIELFSPLGAQRFEELVLSMKVEGFDPTKPIVRDKQTHQIIDGKERQRAAEEAGVQPIYLDIEFSDDLERIRFAIRANMLRRHGTREDRDAVERTLRDRLLGTRDVSQMLGKLVTGEGHGKSVLASERFTSRKSRNSHPQFKQTARDTWGTVERYMSAARDAREWIEQGGVGQKQIAMMLQQRYNTAVPLKGGTVWSLARNAERWERDGFEFPPYGEVPQLPSQLPSEDNALE
jgi:hypothetical protein